MRRYYTHLLFLLFIALCAANSSVAQTWTKKKDFINGYSSSAFIFSINDTIYVGNTGAQDFYKYDYTTDTWTPKGNTPAGFYDRTGSTGFSVNGKGYVIGGVNNTGAATAELWQYDPPTDSWTQKANFPGGKRAWGFVFVIGNNAYFGGGSDTVDLVGFTHAGKKDFWQYNTVTGAWTVKKDLPYDSSYLVAPFAFTLGNKGYISCGTRYDMAVGHGFGETNKTWEYDTTANTWTAKADLPGIGREGGVSFVLNNKAYCGAGVSAGATMNDNDYYTYTAAADKWDTLTLSSPLGGRVYAIAATIGTNKAYLGTGWVAPGTTTYYQDWWEFNAITSEVPAKSLTLTGFSCYPVPCNDYLQVQFDEKNIGGTYTIFNAIGQRVAAGMFSASRIINTTALPSGAYVLIVNNGKETAKAKFIVRKN